MTCQNSTSNSLRLATRYNTANKVRCFWHHASAIQEVGSHQKFKSYLRSNRELWYFCTTVGVSDLVGEILTNFLQHVRWDFSEVHFIRLVFMKLSWSAQHRLYRPRCQCVLSLDDELVTVAADQLHVHRFGALTSSIRCLLLMSLCSFTIRHFWSHRIVTDNERCTVDSQSHRLRSRIIRELHTYTR